MSVLDGESKAPLPSMSWNSVVPEASERQAGHDTPDREPASELPSEPPSEPHSGSISGSGQSGGPDAGAAGAGPTDTSGARDLSIPSFTAGATSADDGAGHPDPSGSMSLGAPVAERVTLGVTPPSVLSPGAPPLGLDGGQSPVPPLAFDRSSDPADASAAGSGLSVPLLSSAPSLSPAPAPAPAPGTSAPSGSASAPPAAPAPTSAPGLGGSTSSASTFSPVKIDVARVTPPSAPEHGGVPAIVEATPHPAVADHPAVAGPAVAAAPAADPLPAEPSAGSYASSPDVSTTGEMPTTAAPAAPAPAPAPAPSIPAVPAAPVSASPPMSLPAQVAPGHLANPLAYGAMPPTQRTQRRRSSGGSGFGLVLALVVLAGLIGAGIVFGRPYLFPDEWDESARVYADDIEAIRGVEFVEPLLIVSEPTSDYRARVGDELLGTWEQSLPMWRSFGLAAGGTDREVLDSLIEDRSPARYSRADGQVYHDAAVRPDELDALLTREMAIAALDQDFRFSSRMARRTMLDAAMTEAHVLQQATLIQSQSAAPEPIRPTDDSPLAFLPPVLDYQLTAPTVFAELLTGFDDVAANPLDGIEAGGPGPLVGVPLAEAREAAPLAGESVVGSPRTMDREFWYLVFAAYHEPAVARRMTTNLAAAALTEFSSGDRSCFAATFEAVSIDVLPLLAGDLASWASAASPALGATTGPTSQTTVELRTCDPGDTFTPTARFGIARDLISWQAADLAVASAVVAGGGDQAAVSEALGRLAQSGAAQQVVGLDPTVTATEMARVARVAAEPILAEAILGTSDAVDG